MKDRVAKIELLALTVEVVGNVLNKLELINLILLNNRIDLR